MSPNRYAGGYGYPAGNGSVNAGGSGGLGVERPGYRPATPNKRCVLFLLGGMAEMDKGRGQYGCEEGDGRGRGD